MLCMQTTALPDVLLLQPFVMKDARGYFFESFNQRAFAQATGLHDMVFVQDNHSQSRRGVLRGLHYQTQPAQGKLVRVTRGAIFDVVVDLRRSSAYFGRWYGTVLSARNRHQLWVPAGFAHGFVTTSAVAEVQYKTTAYWQPEHEHCLLWSDPALGINWPLPARPIVSERDARGVPLAHAVCFT